MRLIDADALKYKNLAEVNGRLTYVLTAEEIDNAPTVEGEILTEEAYSDLCLRASRERPQGNDDCEGCKHDNKASTEYPCSVCKNNHLNMFEWRSEKK